MTMPAADYDGAWKYALEHYFPQFLASFFPTVYATIDWTVPYVVRASELQQLAPEDQAGKQCVDFLVAVQCRDGTPALVLIHIEVQAQRDTEFPMLRPGDTETGRPGDRFRSPSPGLHVSVSPGLRVSTDPVAPRCAGDARSSGRTATLQTPALPPTVARWPCPDGHPAAAPPDGTPLPA